MWKVAGRYSTGSAVGMGREQGKIGLWSERSQSIQRNACLHSETSASLLAKGVAKSLTRNSLEKSPTPFCTCSWLPVLCPYDILSEGFLWPQELRSARDSMPRGAAFNQGGAEIVDDALSTLAFSPPGWEALKNVLLSLPEVPRGMEPPLPTGAAH